MELQSESGHAEAEEQHVVAVCREWKQGERVQEAAEAQEAKESVLGAVKAHQSVQVTECEMPEALQAAAEAAEAQQARVEDQQDPPPPRRGCWVSSEGETECKSGGAGALSGSMGGWAALGTLLGQFLRPGRYRSSKMARSEMIAFLVEGL